MEIIYLAAWHGRFSSLTRDWTWSPWKESRVSATGPPEKVPSLLFFNFIWEGIDLREEPGSGRAPPPPISAGGNSLPPRTGGLCSKDWDARNVPFCKFYIIPLLFRFICHVSVSFIIFLFSLFFLFLFFLPSPLFLVSLSLTSFSLIKQFLTFMGRPWGIE